MKQLVPIGILIIFIGIILVFIGALSQIKDGKNTKIAVGGFIGFIPFGIWNDKRLSWIIFGFTALMFVIWIFVALLNSNR